MRDAGRDLLRRPHVMVAAVFVVLIMVMSFVPQAFAGWFGDGDPRLCDISDSAAGPSTDHPFGLDKQGCDIWANVVYGARDSVAVGVLASALALVLAVVLGMLAAYYLGLVDAIVSRLSDVFFGFPFILGTLVVLTAFRSHNVWTVSIALAAFTWPTFTRLMRSSALAVKAQDHVTAARGLGASDWRLMRKHVLPGAVSPVIVLSALGIGTVIAAEATLTFLGVGLQAPAISWGLQLSAAQSDFQAHPHLLLFPGLFLALTVLSFLVLGDAAEDLVDRRRRDA